MRLSPGPAIVASECESADFATCMNDCGRELSNAGYTSEECADAVRTQNGCLAELSCDALAQWREKEPVDDYPCREADILVRRLCY